MSDRTDDLDTTDGEDELAELRALAPGSAPVTWEEPPAGLWDRIAAETVGTGPAHAGDAAIVPLQPRRAHRGAPTPWFLAAAAAVAVAIGAVAVFASLDRDATTTLASGTLERLAGTSGEGRAELVEEDGAVRLHVDTSDLDPADGFLEVWVIDTGVSRLVSLGPLRADGVYDLPDSLDPEEFPIVDISAEPIDGDPTHSGNSLLRGQLEF